MKNTLKSLYLLTVFVAGGTNFLHAQEAAAPSTTPPAAESPKIEAVAQAEKSAEPKADLKAEVKAPDPEAEKVAAMRKEISELSLERELLSARAAHAKEELAAEQIATRIEMEKVKFDMEQRTQKMAKAELDRKEKLAGELSGLKLEVEKLKAEKEIAAARADAKLSELKLADAESKVKLTSMMTQIAVKEKSREAAFYADNGPQQLDNPLRGKRLVISDRRIELNGPIGTTTAEHVSTRINFYNNKDSKKPIFIVIDNSPGGSVMSGYKILRSMETSDAPIYVVVKQFAASMAATIATLADHSVAYPNAIILHHQIASGVMGNLTQQRESLKEMEEWWRRLADPIAKKMGITREEFIERMYKEISSGDWQEFGDDAQKLKWVDHIVDEIHETALVKSPDAKRPTTTRPTVIPVRRTSAQNSVIETAVPVQATGMELYEQIDQDGNPFVRLPRPNPIDHYYMHNPDNYYRFK